MSLGSVMDACGRSVVASVLFCLLAFWKTHMKSGCFMIAGVLFSHKVTVSALLTSCPPPKKQYSPIALMHQYWVESSMCVCVWKKGEQWRAVGTEGKVGKSGWAVCQKEDVKEKTIQDGWQPANINTLPSSLPSATLIILCFCGIFSQAWTKLVKRYHYYCTRRKNKTLWLVSHLRHLFTEMATISRILWVGVRP